MSKLGRIKENIKFVLDTLKRKEILGNVQVDDFKSSVFSRNFSKFPAAVLSTASTDSQSVTNVQNLRTYTFDIVVMVKKEDVSSPEQVEDLIESILNEFDNDPTLKGGGNTGEADGGVMPSSSSPAPVDGTNYIAFVVTLQVKAVRDLSYV